MDSKPNNLPLQLSSFIGRERELGEVRGLLESSRLVTLTGAGGCGKTRLTLEVASALCRDNTSEHLYADGVWLVELAALSDAELVLQAVALALGVSETKGRSLQTALLAFAQAKNLLIILDNCEHVIDACAALAETLLRSAPRVSILTTTREPLGIVGEHAYPVPPLSTPLAGQTLSPEQIAQSDAVRLFVARAQAARGRFELSAANAAAVGEICRQLDGLPLAIELAAARTRALGIDQIGARLSERFHLLSGSQRGSIQRHQTLRSVIDWSYNLLTDEERVLFRRLSVFAGGWTLEAAEQVTPSADIRPPPAVHLPPSIFHLSPSHVLDLLTHLVDKSLVGASDQAGVTRYRMLDSIQQYAAEKLQESGESDPMRQRHLTHFLALAETAEPALCSAERMPWLDRPQVDHDNLRAALRWAILSEQTEKGLRLASALCWFWKLRNFSGEARRWYAELLAQPDVAQSPRAWAKTLYSAGHMAWTDDEFQAARPLAEQSVSLWRSLPEPDGLAYALSLLGIVLSDYGEHEQARSVEQESVALFRAAGNRWGEAYALLRIGMIARAQRDFASARTNYEACAHIARQIGDAWLLAFPLSHLGSIAMEEGEYAAARVLYEERLVLHRQTGDKLTMASGLNMLGEALRGLGELAQAEVAYTEAEQLYRDMQTNIYGWADSVNNLGRTLRARGDFQRAAQYHRQALAMRLEIANPVGVALSLEAIGVLAAAGHRDESAARLLAMADAIFTKGGARLDAADQPAHDRALADVRQRLGARQFAAAWAEGQQMNRDQAVAYAERLLGEVEAGKEKSATPSPMQDYPAGLSAREVEVLRLVARGLTNPQIAETLVISVRTVNAHLRAIYGKLDVSTRTAAARTAAEHKLI